MFITGILEFLAGMWLVGWSESRRQRQRDREQAESMKRHLLMDKNLKERAAQLDLREKRLEARDPLEKVTVEDALLRESRAKAALRAVLARYGVQEEGIQDVMDSVDGFEDGDG